VLEAQVQHRLEPLHHPLVVRQALLVVAVEQLGQANWPYPPTSAVVSTKPYCDAGVPPSPFVSRRAVSTNWSNVQPPVAVA
jgi:hypothetical protein